MTLIRTQAVVTVTVPGHDVARAAESLRQALIPYPDARIVALTQKTNWMSSFLGTTALIAAVDYTPAT
ncbi:hypothetical protein MT349_19220 [Rathayibacter caricis]|uniref:hypothetical protein n=1 Tax=Rathayibacter caricis TaxID=110936 RepID=UPI001FB253E4|nr:hypothetical protein [Rathayibacter caricis]MCJ1697919.1 hypothetical protein [Rathayibacter caricis]